MRCTRSGRVAIPARNGAPGLQPQAGQETGFAESDGSGRFVASSTRLARLQERDRVALGTEWIRAGLKTTRQMSKGAAAVDFMQFLAMVTHPLGSSFWHMTRQRSEQPLAIATLLTAWSDLFPAYRVTSSLEGVKGWVRPDRPSLRNRMRSRLPARNVQELRSRYGRPPAPSEPSPAFDKEGSAIPGR
jgi:hypothetical protein